MRQSPARNSLSSERCRRRRNPLPAPDSDLRVSFRPGSRVNPARARRRQSSPRLTAAPVPPVSAIASALVEPPPLPLRHDTAPPPPPPHEIEQRRRQTLFRRAVDESAAQAKTPRPAREQDNQPPSDRGPAAPATGVVAFPGLGGDAPQFLAQLIAQTWMPDGGQSRAHGATAAYGAAEARARPQMLFGPVRPVTVLA